MPGATLRAATANVLAEMVDAISPLDDKQATVSVDEARIDPFPAKNSGPLWRQNSACLLLLACNASLSIYTCIYTHTLPLGITIGSIHPIVRSPVSTQKLWWLAFLFLFFVSFVFVRLQLWLWLWLWLQ
jgi:hypothetical protein